MLRKSLECPVPESVSSDTCPWPAAQGAGERVLAELQREWADHLYHKVLSSALLSYYMESCMENCTRD